MTELSQVVGMTRATTFRLLLSLEQTGFVDRIDNRYRLGWQMSRLGRLADPYRGAVARIQPILDEYAVQLNETLSFAMLRNQLEFDLVAEASGARMLNVTQNYVGGSWAPARQRPEGSCRLSWMTSRLGPPCRTNWRCTRPTRSAT